MDEASDIYRVWSNAEDAVEGCLTFTVSDSICDATVVPPMVIDPLSIRVRDLVVGQEEEG